MDSDFLWHFFTKNDGLIEWSNACHKTKFCQWIEADITLF